MRMRYVLSALAVTGLAAGSAAFGTRAAAGTTATAATAAVSSATSTAVNWGKPWFIDQFNATSVNKWWYVYDDPTGKTPRTAQSVTEKGGVLNLVDHTQAPYGWVGGGVGFNANQTYGRWVIRFRAYPGAGAGPGFLLWPAGPWPQSGEIDMIGNFPPNRHGGDIYLLKGTVAHAADWRFSPSVDFTKWHTFAMDWLPDYLTFYLDGKALWTVKRNANSAANFVPNTPFHLAIQNDAGCDGACAPNSSTPSQIPMQIDWVEIYKAPASALK